MLGHWEWEVEAPYPFEFSREPLFRPPFGDPPIGIDPQVWVAYVGWLVRLGLWTCGMRTSEQLALWEAGGYSELNARAQGRKLYRWTPGAPELAAPMFGYWAHVIGYEDVRLKENKIWYPFEQVALVYRNRVAWGWQVREDDVLLNKFMMAIAMTDAWLFNSRDHHVGITEPDRICFGHAWLGFSTAYMVGKVYIKFRAAAMFLGMAHMIAPGTYSLNGDYAKRYEMTAKTETWKYW